MAGEDFEIQDPYRVRFGIRITSYAGYAPGAIHYYGEAWRYDGDTCERQELERTLTEPEAIKLNRHDRGADALPSGFRWKIGSKTGRFDSEESVIDAGRVYFSEKYGSEVAVIELGAHYDLDSPELALNSGVIKMSRET